jgi:hypothetical protein
MKKKWLFFGVMVLLMISVAGCNLPSQGGDADLSVEELLATYQEQTQIAEDLTRTAEAAVATATETVQPSETLTPTVTSSPTTDVPMVSVSVDTNCRTGPGKIYDWIGALLVGEKAEVIGRAADGQYWVIKNPDRAGECWLWGNYASVTGPFSSLPVYTPPPTPTPVFNWAGTWTTYAGPEGGPYEVYTMVVTVDAKDFTGLIEPGGGVQLILSGTIKDDYLSVSGTWSNAGWNGTFEFYGLGVNQFKGNGDNGIEIFGWCGGRSGAGQPVPCQHP